MIQAVHINDPVWFKDQLYRQLYDGVPGNSLRVKVVTPDINCVRSTFQRMVSRWDITEALFS